MVFFSGIVDHLMEKRRYPRVNCEIESNYKNLAQTSSTVLDFTTVNDLSEGGLRFRTNHFLPVNHRVYFRIQIPKAPAIESMAELAWIRQIPSLNCYEAGARFVEFPLQHKRTLQNFIFQNLVTI